MARTTITVTTDIELDVETAAKWFAALDDDQMAKFLVAVAAEARNYPSSADNQWYYLGGHLKNCECSTEEAREMIRSWAHWMEHSTHGAAEREEYPDNGPTDPWETSGPGR
jgi:hypothetical protein